MDLISLLLAIRIIISFNDSRFSKLLPVYKIPHDKTGRVSYCHNLKSGVT